MKLLIVEDSQALANRLVEILDEIPGLEIVGSSGGVDESVRLIDLLHPDTLLVDLQLDGGSGLDLLRTVRDSWEEMAVVIWTNSVSPFVRQACLKAGADFFLDKSNDLGELVAILKKIGEEKSSTRLVHEPGDVVAVRRKKSA